MASMPARAGQPADVVVDLPAPFSWSGEHIRCALPGGRALFTTRRGGVSAIPFDTLNLGILTDDDEAAVGVNRDRVAALVGIARERTLQGMQVHGTRVRRVRELPPPSPVLEAADGQATALEAVAAVVLTADCLPVALFSAAAVAIVHAGWRGLAGGILAEGVRALRELGADGELHAAIGPGAGACCYETGAEVHAALAAYGPRARSGEHADLKHVARRQLRDAGVGAVHDVGLCTICAAPGLFFSHRRDRGVTGRQGAFVWRSWPS
jgi:YfiH family protein